MWNSYDYLKEKKKYRRTLDWLIRKTQAKTSRRMVIFPLGCANQNKFPGEIETAYFNETSCISELVLK